MLTTVALGFVMAFIWKTQKVYAGFNLWTLSNFTVAAGFFLLGLRGYAPDLLTIVTGNSLAAVGMILSTEGNRRFLGLGETKLFSFGLLVLHALGLAYFTYADNKIVYRIAVSSVCMAIISGRSAYIFYMQPVETLTYRFAGLTYSIFTLLMFVRMALTFESTKITDLFAPTGCSRSSF